MKFVSPLSDTDRQILNDVYTRSDKPSLRRRVHAILLSDSGYAIKQISAILTVNQKTVSIWFNVWRVGGLSGLSDRPHSGRPTIYNEKDLVLLKVLAAETPRHIKVIHARLLQETEKTSSTKTISRALKK
ncbi:helix-turn-helix domain-containing protein [Pseudomonas sp. A34-9]|uniref:helix-turn-helix domain-containing protein n=1 Tax=Pseudomonas sp. A34-9 TaxID=3034675 RepID=UPI00240D4E90|nr:helix-turn-helix domain-containing protein [Pseudomonas sp. A34-9]